MHLYHVLGHSPISLYNKYTSTSIYKWIYKHILIYMYIYMNTHTHINWAKFGKIIPLLNEMHFPVLHFLLLHSIFFTLCH